MPLRPTSLRRPDTAPIATADTPAMDDILENLENHQIFSVPGTKEIPIIFGTSYPENRVR